MIRWDKDTKHTFSSRICWPSSFQLSLAQLGLFSNVIFFVFPIHILTFFRGVIVIQWKKWSLWSSKLCFLACGKDCIIANHKKYVFKWIFFVLIRLVEFHDKKRSSLIKIMRHSFIYETLVHHQKNFQIWLKKKAASSKLSSRAPELPSLP